MNKTPSTALPIASRGSSAGDMSESNPYDVPTPRPIKPFWTWSEGLLRFLPGLALLMSLTASTLAQENQELGRMWTASFVDHLVRARSWLPEDDPFFSKVLGGKSAEEFLDVLWPPGSRRSPSWIGYAVKRDVLIESGWKAIQDSEDPAIVAARELVILMRKNEKRGRELDAKEEALGAELARALFACYGQNSGSDGVGSDGTMTPRFTDGVVEGVPSRSDFGGTIAPYGAAPHRAAPYRTVFYGLYARNAEFDNEYPFSLPKIWFDRKDELDLTKPVNFVSTNDITRGNRALDTSPYTPYSGGNSGSVVVNQALEVVGVVSNGNIESLHNDFVFRDDVPRAVSAHVDGIMEALVKIYDAHRVAEELTGE